VGLQQDNTVRLNSNIITLGKLRELVNTTETWADATLVKIENNGGQVLIEAKFGDILR
jgi:hypothetical protein